MNNPLSGLRVLTACLEMGGIMKLGLYSSLARRHIRIIQREITELGIEDNIEGILKYRRHIIKSRKDHHIRITKSFDFFTVSTLRDLLFHKHEHTFTIPEIKDNLNQLGLKFCGFESNKISSFRKINQGFNDLYDLDLWQIYEEANPSSFSGMYQFWCQKVTD